MHQLVGVGMSDNTFVWHPSAAGTVSYGTGDNVNKYPTVGAASLTYDGNKNLTSDGTWTYSYDTENHLLTATAGAVSASYVYEPSGRQAQKTVGANKTRFIYDGLDLIATYDGAGVLQNRYVHGPGMDEPAIQVTAAGVLSFFHRDFQNSIVALTDNSGAVTNKYTYSPFGESAPLSGTIFGYTAQRYDTETGLYYYKARHFSPTLGRFLQTDPIGYAGGDLNLYAYVGNDPMNFRDPLGLSELGPNVEYMKADLLLKGGVSMDVNVPTGPLDQGRFPGYSGNSNTNNNSNGGGVGLGNGGGGLGGPGGGYPNPLLPGPNGEPPIEGTLPDPLVDAIIQSILTLGFVAPVRLLNIYGEGELAAAGFLDVETAGLDPIIRPLIPRPSTAMIPSSQAIKIAVNSSPIFPKTISEIVRLARPGARIVVTGSDNSQALNLVQGLVASGVRFTIVKNGAAVLTANGLKYTGHVLELVIN